MSELPSDADWRMWRDFSAMRRALDRAVEQRLQRDAKVSTPEFEVLSSLFAAENRMLRAGALAEALGWEKSRISHQVSRMAARGLVSRQDCPSDARGTWVVLTEAGADALDIAGRGYVEVLTERFFGQVSAQEREIVHAVAARVATDPADSDPAAEACASQVGRAAEAVA